MYVNGQSGLQSSDIAAMSAMDKKLGKAENIWVYVE